MLEKLELENAIREIHDLQGTVLARATEVAVSELFKAAQERLSADKALENINDSLESLMDTYKECQDRERKLWFLMTKTEALKIVRELNK